MEFKKIESNRPLPIAIIDQAKILRGDMPTAPNSIKLNHQNWLNEKEMDSAIKHFMPISQKLNVGKNKSEGTLEKYIWYGLYIVLTKNNNYCVIKNNILYSDKDLSKERASVFWRITYYGE